MATLEMINPEKPIILTGFKTTISEDADLISLASKLGNERLRLIAEPITEAVTIKGQDSGQFLKSVMESSKRDLFDANLQGMAKTKKGEPLLTGWLMLEDFIDVLNNHITTPIASRLIDRIKDWSTIGVEEVYFDGFDLR